MTPSPFYVRDEVETALDGRNVGRLLQVKIAAAPSKTSSVSAASCSSVGATADRSVIFVT